MCSSKSLRRLRIHRVRGVPHEVVMHAMAVVGPQRKHLIDLLASSCASDILRGLVIHLSIKEYRGDLLAVLRLCQRLTFLGVDAYKMSTERSRELLDRVLPHTLRELVIYPPWDLVDLLEWIQEGLSGPSASLGQEPGLLNMDVVSLGLWDKLFEHDEECELGLRLVKAALEFDVAVEMPENWWAWKERSGVTDVDRDEPSSLR